MRIGLLGVGRIGATHARLLASHPEVTELVLGDVMPERARDVAERLGVRAAGPIDEVFATPLDGIVVATPTATHADLIERGVDAGLTVFCEKPVAADLARTIEVAQRVAAADGRVQVGFQRRFDAGYRAAREALRSGAVGTLHRLHLLTADPAPPPAEYIPLSGGIFRDCHIHDFDIARWLTGQEVVEVYATGANRGASFFAEANDVDTSVAILTFADGTLATLQGSRYNGGGYDVRAELAGTESTFVVGLDDRAPLRSAEPGVSYPSGEPWPDFWQRFGASYIAEMNAFLDYVAGRRSSACTVAEALEALYIAEAADRSRRERRPVRVEEIRASGSANGLERSAVLA
ncbi:Gfo/Idh/MocA family oxidoreductase [Micromonospora sp. NPDC002296]|uniref:Gfo/Idh/MocA family protein n=1 Tax=Micromonospora sp. NPDC002296 TaxID=3154271 RepID=UPI003324DCCE